MKELINQVLDNLHFKKVDYGDIRIVEEEREGIILKNGVVEGLVRDTNIGFGVRVLKDGAWGFSSSNRLTKGSGNRVSQDALMIARASAQVRERPVVLSELQPQRGRYKTIVEIDPFRISLNEKIRLLLECDKLLNKDNRIKVRQAFLNFHRTRINFASTEGSYLRQELVFSGGGIKVFAMDKDELQVRSYGNYQQAGYEFINSLRLKANAHRIGEEVLMLLAARPCPDKKTTLILDADQMVLQIHESCGHPTELDRVLGAEASYAGTSFLTIEKLNKFRYGSEIVTIVADATEPGGLGTFGWDDEGVPSQRVYLIKDGIFVGYQSSRETAPLIGAKSSGNMRADGWNRIPLVRMTNINLEPGEWKLEDMIADTEDGIFMTTNKSWSIDDKRLNFQFGCEFARRIEKGRLTEVYKNPTYADITPNFWNRCDAIASKSYWRLFGVPNCGKGEPGQMMYVGHGTAPARFRDVQVGIAK